MATFFEAGGYGGRNVPDRTKPRVPAEVRKELRWAAVGTVLVVPGVLMFAFWNVQAQRAQLDGGALTFGIEALGIGAALIIGIGLYLAVAGWSDLPPRTLASGGPGIVGVIVILALILSQFLQQFDFIGVPPTALVQVCGLIVLALYFIAAGWAVLGMRWWLRKLVAAAFALSGLAFVVFALVAAGVLQVSSALYGPLNMGTAAVLGGASIAFGVATWRSGSRATDEQLI